jgi:hypothetical protein
MDTQATCATCPWWAHARTYFVVWLLVSILALPSFGPLATIAALVGYMWGRFAHRDDARSHRIPGDEEGAR